MKINKEDITIGLYMEYIKFMMETSLEGLEKRIKIISILTGKSVDDLMDIDIKDLKRLSKELSNIDIAVSPTKFKNTFEINGITFKSKSSSNKIIISVGESFQFAKIIKNNGKLCLNEMAAIVFTNEDTTYEDRKTLFYDMPLEYIIPYLIYNEKA
jgi:hypothetical protein